MRWTAAAAFTAFITSITFAQAAPPANANPLAAPQAKADPPARPVPPQLPAEATRRLTALARSAMLQYLATRQPAEAQAIPESLQTPMPSPDGSSVPVAELPCEAVITLRQNGRSVATAVGEGQGLARNVITAALRAMRSPRLPDRITNEVLMGLTLELSILGKELELSEEYIPAVVTPGLIGLKLTRGVRDAGLRIDDADSLFRQTFVLPSTAYVLGWDADRIRSQCLREMGRNPLASGLKGTWHVFATLHLIDDPAHGTWQLYRGKILTPAEAIDDEALSAAADRIAAWLTRQIGEDGHIGHANAPLAEQLYAARTLARYGHLRDKPTAVAAAATIVGHVAQKYVRFNDDQSQAHVFTPRPKQELPATAMFLLASMELDTTDEGAAVQTALARYLAEQLAEPKQLAPRDMARAMLALYRADPPGMRLTADALDALLAKAGAGEPGKPASAAILNSLDVASLAWVARAALASGIDDAQRIGKLAVIVAAIAETQYLAPWPLDAFGGYGREQPDTAATGAVVAMLSKAATVLGGPKKADAMRKELAGPITDAKRFCYRMVFRPQEAYFIPADQQTDSAGAVRDHPAAAATSISAATGALEALMAK